MGLPGAGTKPSGWEEPSPPAQRRNIPNYDDGTSLWGNPSQQQNRIGICDRNWLLYYVQICMLLNSHSSRWSVGVRE